nr:hypothetical protein [Acetatifactor sp.]
KRTINQSNDKYELIVKIYKMSKPLLDDVVVAKIDESVETVNKVNEVMVSRVYGNKSSESHSGNLLEDLFVARDSVEKELISAIQEQMAHLIIKR